MTCAQDGYCHVSGDTAACNATLDGATPCDGATCLKYAFVSSIPFDPSQGITAADTLCDQDGNKLQPRGRYRALLSTSQQSAIQHVGADFSWVRSDRSAWANSAQDLLDAKVLNKLDLDYQGTVVDSTYVWSGSANAWEVSTDKAKDSCQDWSTNQSNDACAVSALVGRTDRAATDSQGLNFFSFSSCHTCDDTLVRVYCLQVE